MDNFSGTNSDYAGTKDNFGKTLDRCSKATKGIDKNVRGDLVGIMMSVGAAWGAAEILRETEDEEARNKITNDIKDLAMDAYKFALRLADVLRSEADPDDEDQEEDEDENE